MVKNILFYILVVLGIIIISFTKQITRLIRRLVLHDRTTKKPSRYVILVIQILVMLVLTFTVFLKHRQDFPYFSILNKDEIRVSLLERGNLTPAKVKKSYYEFGAPEGWKVEYVFQIEEKTAETTRVYEGWSQGPEKYYKNLSKGDKVSIIYDPCDPRINCEIKRLLNHPSFRKAFKKAGKLQLLEKFKDEYELEDYTFKEWYSQQQTK